MSEVQARWVVYLIINNNVHDHFLKFVENANQIQSNLDPIGTQEV